MPPAVEVWSLNHWTAREVQKREGFEERCFNCEMEQWGWGRGTRALQTLHGGWSEPCQGSLQSQELQRSPWSPHAHPLPARDKACSSLLESAGGLLTPLGTPLPQAWLPGSLVETRQQEITEYSLSPALVPVSSRRLVLIISFHLPHWVPRGPARPVKEGKVQSKLRTGLIYGTCQPRQGS